MNKSDIIRGLASRSDFTQAKAEVIINDLLEIIGLSLACGEDVNLSGFGKFEVRPHRAMERRNPKTGAAVHVAAKNSLGFRASPQLKDRLNG